MSNLDRRGDAAESNLQLGEEAVQISISNDKFRRLVFDLLAKPEKISKKLVGAFDIERYEVQKFYEFIDHHLEDRFIACNLVDFQGVTYFEDNSSNTTNDLSRFSNREIHKASTVVAIRMSFVYLVEINSELEKIGFDIFLKTERYQREDDDDDERIPLSGCTLSVAFTRGTWAEDVLNWLLKYWKPLLLPQDRLFKFVRKYKQIMRSVSFMLAIMLHFSMMSAFSIDDSQTVSLKESINLTSLEDLGLEEKMNLLVDFLLSGYIESPNNSSLFLSSLVSIGGLMISVAIFTFTAETLIDLVQPRPSFIRFNTHSESYRKEKSRKANRKILKLLASVALGLTLNIIASYV